METLSNKKDKPDISISTKAFMTALLILLALMIATYILTFVVPTGTYDRVMEDGQEVVISDTYKPVEGGISFFKWLFSPILAVTAKGGGTMAAIIAFLLIIGGTFNVLEKSGILKYMLSKISYKYQSRKYTLLCVVSLFFMTLGSCVGSFEECVPMVPIAIALAYTMGWDAMIGLGMSLLAIGCGFATGISNPFTVGVAQELAGLPMFSGISFRVISYVIIYGVLMAFLIPYAKKIEKDPQKSIMYGQDQALRESNREIAFSADRRMDKALLSFVGILAIGILLILASSFVPVLQDMIMPVIGVVFLLAGTISAVRTGMQAKKFMHQFRIGMVSMLPAVLLILLAGSVKYTMLEAKIMDTILFYAVDVIEKTPPQLAILLIYLLVLVMNFFIGSGSAKAFLLMPLITPLMDMTGMSRQLSILAFAYGDGFSNLFYPTGAALLISLGLAGVSYVKWARWSIKIQGAILVVTSIILLIAQSTGY